MPAPDSRWCGQDVWRWEMSRRHVTRAPDVARVRAVWGLEAGELAQQRRSTLHTTAPQELATISRTFHNFWKSLLTFLKYLLVLSHLRIYYTTLKESLNILSPLSSFWLTICYWLLRNMSSPNCGNFCKILSTTLCSSQLGKGLLLLPLGYAAPDHNRQKGNRL